ncbi:hydroxymethylglutaryl-CoA lyase [Rhizorhabdus dicambivorans]|uniref:Hydroxymethylglutaryl-CoA lyase n=1 Tax=Rhizorhabdus dicambivorans TaxID=1850238 RepID=A0A2A4FVE3_9SPHN|nr:hydroxymethylglutaryl-CoA lyase [Rhizorhabdus dicambivorans]ATE63620.1 hydroxymethylglutaryl-CoA lyase [Rhizorhabdus dicambivorans]PCE42746.1 hydroxymethylglutaryl-CoA lyase [Rhizorhabdus dicambivorans]
MSGAAQVEIVEVGPRDGFQSIGPLIPTPTKIALIEQLHAAGIRRMETTSFVSASALPQLADAPAIVAAVARMPTLDSQVLVPTARHAERALAAGARHLSAVLSVSERHNMGNVRRTPMESVADYTQMVAMMPADASMRLNLATSFDCPHVGRIDRDAVLALLEPLVAASADVEIALCDTTGHADPAQVRGLFAAAADRFPQVRAWAFHGHDTYGLGAANVLAAWDVGIRIFDAAVAGLGGCPFAPGATGNVATEDLIWMFDHMGVETGIDLQKLVDAARAVAELPGAQVGGRVRQALGARACLAAS